MSGHSDRTMCCKCGGQMDIYIDWKPHDYVSGTCFECGFEFQTIDGQLTLKEVNAERADIDLKPLKELKKPNS